jgi:hypothetical protein
VTSLAELFPDGDYRFHLTLRRAEPREFFGPQDPSGKILAERRRWLAADPARYSGLHAESAAALKEFSELGSTWGAKPVADIVALGESYEPDILFLTRDDVGRFCVRGGALVFPTGWALEEKMGLPLEAVHGVVPKLNDALASPIQQFLTRLKPGTAFCRDNWGLAATDELNLHPARKLAPPDLPVALDRLWLRVEHQALLALPQSRGVVFGIRIALHRLDAIAGGPAAPGLRRALQTMPEDLARYKRIDTVRAEVIRLL